MSYLADRSINKSRELCTLNKVTSINNLDKNPPSPVSHHNVIDSEKSKTQSHARFNQLFQMLYHKDQNICNDVI